MSFASAARPFAQADDVEVLSVNVAEEPPAEVAAAARDRWSDKGEVSPRLSFFQGHVWRRQSEGGTPTIFLKARLNAASEA
jgi:hypothetical protein